MWRDFFYFSKNERRGIIVLAALILCVFSGTLFYSVWNTKKEIPVSPERQQRYEEFQSAVIQGKDNKSVNDFIPSDPGKNEVKPELFSFNPNEIDSLQLVRLGLERFVISNLLKYRQKGGVFRKPEDVKRIYGLSTEEFNRLLPYIYIPAVAKETGLANVKEEIGEKTVGIDSVPVALSSPVFQKQIKYAKDTLFDLNSVDTLELRKIPGIGNGISQAIYTYRKRLGGFYEVNQLQDIAYISDTLNRWFFVGTEFVPEQINLNKASIQRLTAHPYLTYYQSKVIIEFRKRNGNLKNLKQLALFEEFTPNELARLEPYVSF